MIASLSVVAADRKTGLRGSPFEIVVISNSRFLGRRLRSSGIPIVPHACFLIVSVRELVGKVAPHSSHSSAPFKISDAAVCIFSFTLGDLWRVGACQRVT